MKTVGIPGSRIVRTLTEEQRVAMVRQRQRNAFVILDPVIEGRLQALNEDLFLGCELISSGFLETLDEPGCISWWELKPPNCQAVVQVKLEIDGAGTANSLVFSSETHPWGTQIDTLEVNDEFLDELFEGFHSVLSRT